MTPPRKTTFREDLQRALVEAGLTMDVKEIIGRPYLIGNNADSHRSVLVGTITAIELSDISGLLKLFVSSPTQYGANIQCVYFEKGHWKIHLLDTRDGSAEDIEFTLL